MRGRPPRPRSLKDEIEEADRRKLDKYMARNMFGSIDVAIFNHCMRTGGWEMSAIDRQAPGNRSSKSITTNCW